MKNIFKILLFVFFSGPLTSSTPFKGDKCVIKSEFIYQPGDVGFPSCHASTIIENGKGLLAAWFGGTAEKNPDVGIWLSSFSEGRWTKPIEVANGIQDKTKRYPCWNPVLYNNRGKILLFYKVGPSPSEWWGEMITSDDYGKTWSTPKRLPKDIYGPIKDKPVMLGKGELLCPSSTEYDGWRVHIEFTKDNGLTWERTNALNDKSMGVIQPTILLHPEGKLQMLCRSTSSFILTSWSADNGRTWSEFTSTGLPNPNSGIDAVTLKNGRHLVVYNHLTKGRNVLNVAISGNGKDWKAAVQLENDEKGTEFSYPAVIQTSDGLVHITYTWNRKQIKHVVLDPAKIVSKPFQEGEWPGGTPVTAYTQPDKVQAVNVLSKYLVNSSNGNYFGWNGIQKDSLWLDATEYIEKVESFSKAYALKFHIVQSDNAYLILSYSLDSLKISNDHALGFVTLSSVSSGYCVAPLTIKREKIYKVYLLLKQSNRWFVLSETEDWFSSVKTYIKWAEKFILDKSRSSEEIKTVTSNLTAFKKLVN